MDLGRVQAIINNKEKVDILYKNEPVWIQEVNNNIAKIGFIHEFKEQNVSITELIEKN